MSALTKIFVVLHVVISLLLAAALIVFVNRQENYRISYAGALQKQQLAEASTTALNQQILAIAGQKDALSAELTNQINALKVQISSDQTEVAKLQADKNEKDQSIAQLTAANSSATAALQVAQADIKARQDAFNAIFTQKDKLETQSVDLGNQITALTSAKDILTRQNRYVQEQISQLQVQNAKLSEILQHYNISPTGNTLPAGGAINSTPNVNINGVVRDFKSINGVPYATISLGSADAVTHGMKFKVIDPQKSLFLGYLTVDTVGVHEATGRLDGPAVDQVRANVSEVRTQL